MRAAVEGEPMWKRTMRAAVGGDPIWKRSLTTIQFAIGASMKNKSYASPDLLNRFGLQGTDTLPMMETLKVPLMPASASFTNPFIWVWEPQRNLKDRVPLRR